jgi:pantoate--beta-alanine ligase
MTRVISEPAELRQACDEARRTGRQVGLVPTMGALHAGHHSLIDAATERAECLVVTLFVNPMQFAANEDLGRYPRTFDSDLRNCEQHGVDILFAPSPEAMYPAGFQSRVLVESLTQPLEGQFRPEHFAGVTTVVSKLFNLTGPCVAMFGRKDYQQWKVLERMARDLDMPVELVGCPIVREPDGLALSSRNRYLSEEERHRALGIVTGLRHAHDAWSAGERDRDALRTMAEAPVRERFDHIDYVAAVDPDSLEEPAEPGSRLLIAVAAHLGGTRLIDNVVLGEESRP